MQMRVSGYSLRLILLSVGLLVATIAAVRFAPRIPDVTVVANEPKGGNASRGQPLRIVFSRPVDKRSAERAFVLYPTVPGRFVWPDERTIEFHMNQPLEAKTTYTVLFRPGLSDTKGRVNRVPVRWLFQTGS